VSEFAARRHPRRRAQPAARLRRTQRHSRQQSDSGQLTWAVKSDGCGTVPNFGDDPDLSRMMTIIIITVESDYP
jgi:hypothetical protein